MSRAVTRPPTVGLVLRVRIGEAVADVELLQERSTGWAPGLGGAETPSGEPAGAPDRLPLPDRVRPPSSKSFLFVLAASQGSLQRLLHRVSTFLALIGEHRRTLTHTVRHHHQQRLPPYPLVAMSPDPLIKSSPEPRTRTPKTTQEQQRQELPE